ncbi:MAG: Dyp-type peroxidase [Labilithrix sp.]|nr:Dyp-type peroxidase [Labilithrix sp.]
MTKLDLDDIQGLVLFGHGHLPHARYLHVSFGLGSEPRAWLRGLRGEVNSARRKQLHPGRRVQVALTVAGLAALGLSAAELATFPRELVEGMAGPARARVLGDAPADWDFGGPCDAQPIHALVLLFALTAEVLDELGARLVADLAEHGGAVVHVDQVHSRRPEREPFGFRDGLAQPHVEGSPRTPKESDECLPAGEFVLGYPNDYAELPPSPAIGSDAYDLGKNGSYLVYRKLQQDTAGFWRWMLEHAEPRNDRAAAIKLAARIIGRWPSGAPLARYPDHDPGAKGATNEFSFDGDDPSGHRCPFGAHIRRANPRDMLKPGPAESTKAVRRHRLLRRGRPYGPPPQPTPEEAAHEVDPPARGLVFIALNASFRRQFEFVQQTWANNPKFAGLSDERDPLIGDCPAAGQHFSIQAEPARQRVSGLPTFVKMLGGAYFFVPGLRALERLAR